MQGRSIIFKSDRFTLELSYWTVQHLLDWGPGDGWLWRFRFPARRIRSVSTWRFAFTLKSGSSLDPLVVVEVGSEKLKRLCKCWGLRDQNENIRDSRSPHLPWLALSKSSCSDPVNAGSVLVKGCLVHAEQVGHTVRF